MNKLSIALGVSIFSLSTNVYAADLLAPPPPYKPLPDFHSTPGIPNLPWNTPRRLPEQFELPDSSPPGILQSGHGIADGIVMPDDISSTKLDSEEIYKKNAPSIMRIMTSWPSPVTEKDLPFPCRPATAFDFRRPLARGRAHAVTEGKCWGTVLVRLRVQGSL